LDRYFLSTKYDSEGSYCPDFDRPYRSEIRFTCRKHNLILIDVIGHICKKIFVFGTRFVCPLIDNLQKSHIEKTECHIVDNFEDSSVSEVNEGAHAKGEKAKISKKAIGNRDQYRRDVLSLKQAESYLNILDTDYIRYEFDPDSNQVLRTEPAKVFRTMSDSIFSHGARTHDVADSPKAEEPGKEISSSENKKLIIDFKKVHHLNSDLKHLCI
ncbi:MAG: hypothetical protein MHMPM18_003653, partial [Marteilia pararefringens]